MPHDPGDEIIRADLLGLLLAGRPDRVADAVRATLSVGARSELGGMAEALSALGRAAGELAPSAALRGRVLASIAARRRAPRRAVLVVDMIRDYVAEGGPMEVPRARGIVPELAKRLEEARASDVPVVYVVDRHSAEDGDLDVWGAHAIEGSPGASVWPDIAPAPCDHVIGHATYSAFFNSDLERTLDALKVDTLVLTGCLTELQMFATATDAMQRGYAIEVHEDSQAGTTEVGEQVAIGMMRFMLPYEPARRELLARVSAGA
jgi:nicotinamidase-related amidase